MQVSDILISFLLEIHLRMQFMNTVLVLVLGIASALFSIIAVLYTLSNNIEECGYFLSVGNELRLHPAQRD